MPDENAMTHRERWILAALLLLGLIVRLYALNAPLADSLQAKQIYSANKARQIARPPFDPLRLTLGVLDESGRPMALAEEVPVYITALAALYRGFGEREAWGRLLSIAGSLVAIAAFFALVRREQGRRAAPLASLLLTCAPLFVFYGRAVLPDPWMLAMMLVSAWAYRRYLDDGRAARWWLAAAVAAVAAVAFKYWGLMILVVLAEMTWRAEGRRLRALARPSFVVLVVAIVTPVALWMLLVFLRSRNPVAHGWTPGQIVNPPYLILQDPSVLLDRRWYAAFGRFLVRDCGGVAALLIVLGVAASIRRKRWPEHVAAGGLLGWSVMGLLFFVLLAPKLVDHDYYALMLLPAAAVWGAVGWLRILDTFGMSRTRRATLLVAVGLTLVAAQSPLLSRSRFEVERGKVALGRALESASAPEGRVVALGPGIALITAVHYSRREGWAERAEALPDDWQARLIRWRSQGADCLGLYFDAKATARQRAAFDPMIAALPTVARTRGPGYEFLVLRLDDAAIAALETAPIRR